MSGSFKNLSVEDAYVLEELNPKALAIETS